MTHPTTPTDLAVLLVTATLTAIRGPGDQAADLDRTRIAAIEEYVTTDTGPAPDVQGDPGEPFMRWLRGLVEQQQDLKIRMAQVIGTLEAMAATALVDLEAATGTPALQWVENWRAAQN